jgi:hypothetical protein
VASSGDIESLLGNGDGTFQSPVSISSIIGARLAVADFNGDGKLDLAATNGSNVDVFLGNGNGTFQAPVAYFVGTAPGPLTVADVNADGKLDSLATTCYQGYCSDPQVAILLGNGYGMLQPVSFLNVGQPGDALGSPGVGDFNADGIPDLAVPDLKGPSTIQVFPSDGGGKFAAPVGYNYSGTGVLVGDFNGDGNADLMGLDLWFTGFGVVLGNGDGRFGPAANLYLRCSARLIDSCGGLQSGREAERGIGG